MVPAALNPPRGPATAGGTAVSRSSPPRYPQHLTGKVKRSPRRRRRRIWPAAAARPRRGCLAGMRPADGTWRGTCNVPVLARSSPRPPLSPSLFIPCTHPWVQDACVPGFSACAGGQGDAPAWLSRPLSSLAPRCPASSERRASNKSGLVYSRARARCVSSFENVLP